MTSGRVLLGASQVESLDVLASRMYDDSMSLDPEQLRIAMRHWATGVTVVTSAMNGIRHGMTVNSFTSISLEPPLVLVSLERNTRTHAIVERSRIYGVTILNGTQQDISDCFAGRHTEHEDRFTNLDTFTLVTGASFITGGLAFLDCKVVEQFETGTHTLYIGEVVAIQFGVQSDPFDQPLIYHNRTYRRLQK